MIKSHPNDATLLSFVEGILPPTNALLLSAHCDMCETCLNKTRMLTESLASTIFSEGSSDAAIPREFVSMFESITHDNTLLDADCVQTVKKSIDLDGRSFLLPNTLARYADKIGEWSHLVGKIWHASVDIGGGSLAQFIFMENGGSVPEHSHKGTELTLVINGSFADGVSFYSSGDFISLDHEHTHAPTADAHEGCLVFIILDKPLHFTSGWARLINPLSHVYFKANTSR
jgi:putative transcriptional regulator